VLVFVFYQFERPPLLFNPAAERAVRAAQPAEYASIEAQYSVDLSARDSAARMVASARDLGDGAGAASAVQRFRTSDDSATAARGRALALAEKVTGQTSRDVNYIIPRFVIDHLPIGLAGLFIAAVIAAAMNAISGELNSLSTTSVFDFYRRWIRAEASDKHFVTVSRVATALWGAFACVVATYAVNLGSLIEVVNKYGSFFYGSILGVFVLAMIPWARGTGAFLGLIAGMLAVFSVNRGAPTIAFLWYNVIGAVVVVIVGAMISLLTPGRASPAVQR